MADNKICVSIGATDIESLKNMVSECLQTGADFMEIRFDFFDKSGINDALDVVLDHKDQSLFTCRAAYEGGKYSGSEQERVSILRRLAAFRPMLLDVEYKTMRENEDLLDQFTAQNCDILVSWHDFERTPGKDELAAQLNAMKGYGGNIKIVTMAKTFKDSISILELYEEARKSDVNLVAFCMGEHGVLSRVLCTYAGARFTYASIHEAVAPGQLTVLQMKNIYERLAAEKPDLNQYDLWKEKGNLDEILECIRK